MAKTSILIALLLQLCTMIQGLVPCSEHYSLITDPETNNVMGQIKIPSPSSKHPPYNLKVGFNTNPFVHLREPVARIEIPYQSVQDIEENKPLMFPIHFPADVTIPRLTKISFNNQQICSNSGGDSTTVEIEQIFEQLPSITTPLPPTNGVYPKRNGGPRVIIPRSPPGSQPPRDNSECGFSRYADRTNLLISNGEVTRPGQWPWVVAIFALRKNHEFICGGSILSNKHILTAAHCLKLHARSNDTLQPNMLVVALGRFNLHQWNEEGTENREVASFKIHPDYTHTSSGDSDLAILTLKTPVEFSKFIKPICLWSGPIELTHVVNRTGYVVGWGQDELGNRYTEDPRMARVSIVDQETCLRSYWIFGDLTSSRTFCAGMHGRSGPCNTDSGSGLVHYDESRSRYQLRGVVSRSLIGDDYLCDLRKYVVYVDVAKYLPWIHQQISTTINNNIPPNNVEPQQSTQIPNGDNNNDECGVNHYANRTNLLVTNEQETNRCQWPWVVALFVMRKNHTFICDGSILSNKHILTAAHCLKIRKSNDTLQPNMLVVALGRFNLHQWNEEGTENREVASFKIHPDYTHTLSGDSDLAILTLKTPVEFSEFIKPICLWSGPIELTHVVNRTGYVVGWGQDEFGNPYTEDPRMARVSIVDQETCLRSYWIFGDLTSSRTFCAGMHGGSGPCNTDSGSGLVLYDASRNRYQLRGVVSRSLLGDDYSCDLRKYVVYVDVAKYVPWIQEQISTT